MATKMSQDHARFLIEEKDHHKLIDIFLMLVKLSSEVKVEDGKRFIIHSNGDSKYRLSKSLLGMIPSVKSMTTIYTSLNLLEEEGLFKYNKSLLGWEIVGMENSFGGGKGFMDLREIFYTPIFYSLSYLEKKTLFYMTYIMSLKKYKSFKKIRVNLLNPQSELRKIYKTKNVYYIRKALNSIIEKFFVSTDEFVESMAGLNPTSKKRAKKRNSYKYSLKPKWFLDTTLSRPKKSEKERVKEYRESDSSFYGYLFKLPIYMPWTKKHLSDELKLQLLRQCAALDLRDKQFITIQILNQLNKGNLIKSLNKYIEKTIKTYLESEMLLS